MTQNKTNISGEMTWQKQEEGQAPATGPLTDRSAGKIRSSRRSRKSDSAFRTISEVADILDVQQHVLRFWETKFSQVRPLKRGGGRRYYRPEDVELLKCIHNLLYTEKYTIKGVQKLLKGQGKKALLAAPSVPVQPEAANQHAGQDVSSALSRSQKTLLEDTLIDLKALRSLITQ